MSIKPVDFQVMIPRTMEAAKASNDEIQKNLVNQQQQTSATQQKAEDSLKQVYSRAQAQNVHIKEKQKEHRKNNGDGKKSGDKNGKDGEKEPGKLNYEVKTSTIDIKI